MAVAGTKQSADHVAKRIEALRKTRAAWSAERKAEWVSKISKTKTGRVPWNKGTKGAQKGWNKGLRKHAPEETRRLKAERQRKRRQKNGGLRLHESLSCLMRISLKGSKSGKKWETLVGYTLEDLKRHLQSLFHPGMTFENFGAWHIDHKQPRASFTFASPEDEDFKKCWALSNLQPLWKLDNLKKGSKHPLGD